MSIRRVEVHQTRDQSGAIEELTWDLFPLLDASATGHLDEHGLPKVGTELTCGMILVGRIGRTELFDSSRQPTPLEVHGLPLAEIRERYGHMWEDRCVYVTDETTGIVRSARLVVREGALRVAEIEIYVPNGSP